MVKDLEFKKYKDLKCQDLFDISHYVIEMYHLITIGNDDDYIIFLNRLRHILEIVSDYGENEGR